MTYSARTTPLRTLCGAALLIMGTAAQSLPLFPHQRAEAFATCSGRIAALSAHQRGRHDPEAARNDALVDMFELMVEASLPHAELSASETHLPVHWRSQGWREVAALLSDTTYSRDSQQVANAQLLLDQHIADCRSMVL